MKNTAYKQLHYKSMRGFTLLEILVSLMIFSIASLGLGKLFAGSMSQNTRSERITSAIQVAQGVLDGYRTIDPGTLPNSTTTINTTSQVGTRVFNVATTICPTGTAYCGTTSMRELSVQVNFKGKPVHKVNVVYAQLK